MNFPSISTKFSSKGFIFLFLLYPMKYDSSVLVGVFVYVVHKFVVIRSARVGCLIPFENHIDEGFVFCG